MKKYKIGIIAALAMIMSLCCIVFVACAPSEPEPDEPVKYKVNWMCDEHVDHIEVAGYDELPTEFAEDTVVTFTPVAKDGWLIKDVTPHSAIEDLGNGSYKFVADGELNVKIVCEEHIISNKYLTVDGCSLKVENDQVYFAITGTYEGAAVNCHIRDIYFALQDNCLMWATITGNKEAEWWDSDRGPDGSEWLASEGQGYGYSEHALYPETKSIIANDDGTYEARINLTGVSNYWYGTKLTMGYAEGSTDLEAEEFKPDWMSELEETQVEFNGRIYKLHVPAEGADEWRTSIAIIIYDKYKTEYYAKNDVTVSSYGLEVIDGKPCMVLKGSVAKYKADTDETRYWVYFATVHNGNWGNTAKSTSITQTFVPSGGSATFTIVWDLSGLAAGQSCWLHIGESGNDLAFKLADKDKTSIEVGGKKYYLELTGENTEDQSPELFIEAAKAE